MMDQAEFVVSNANLLHPYHEAEGKGSLGQDNHYG